MSLFSRHPLFDRKDFIVFQNCLFVTISLLVTLEKCYKVSSEWHTLIPLYFIGRSIVFGGVFKVLISEPIPSINCLP